MHFSQQLGEIDFLSLIFKFHSLFNLVIMKIYNRFYGFTVEKYKGIIFFATKSAYLRRKVNEKETKT